MCKWDMAAQNDTEDNGRDEDMEPITFRAPACLVEEFDDAVWEAKVDGRLDRDDNRSSVLRTMMKNFVEDGEI